MDFFAFLFSNKMINAALLAWFIAQTLKVFFVILSQKKLDFSRFIGAGGMPSSHSSLVMALTVSVGKFEGFDSAAFAVSFVTALVIMYDAAGVRRAAGQQAKVLNKIVENWGKEDPHFIEERLKELLGHTPLEVFAGALLGIFIGMIA